MHHAETINYLAVFVATLSAFAIGALWYSPALFTNPWMKANGFTAESIKANPGNMGLMFGTTFVLAFVMAYSIARFIDPATALSGMEAGATIGIVWVAAAIGTHYLFERKSLTHFLINAGYTTVSLTVMGAIIGALK